MIHASLMKAGGDSEDEADAPAKPASVAQGRTCAVAIVSPIDSAGEASDAVEGDSKKGAKAKSTEAAADVHKPAKKDKKPAAG